MLKALQIGAISKNSSSSSIASSDSNQERLVYHQEEPASSRMEPTGSQYSMFHDYLGLFNLVSSMRDQYSHSNNNSNSRERRDSLGSAASSSDFSMSTGGSAPDSSDGSCEFFGGSGGIGSYPSTPTDFFRAMGESDEALLSFGHHHSFDTQQQQQQQSSSNRTGGGGGGVGMPSSTLLERGSLSVRVPNRPVKQQVCVFCRNNGESESFYTSHCLKDAEGKVTCPVLRAYTCPLCGANGDLSHTIKYCPENNQASKVSTVASQMKRATITITRKK